jgi:SAM-dependent methyltransferase
MRFTNPSGLSLGLLCLSVSALAQTPRHVERLAPFVPSPQPVVDLMLDAAELKSGETVYDLGCGDGRVLFTAAEKFKAKAVGVELSPALARDAADQARKRGLGNRVKVIQGDLLAVDLSPADVVTLYLLTSSNELLKPKLESSLRPGARVVSHDFEIRGWTPLRTEKLDVLSRVHTIYVYEMPPTPANKKH